MLKKIVGVVLFIVLIYGISHKGYSFFGINYNTHNEYIGNGEYFKFYYPTYFKKTKDITDTGNGKTICYEDEKEGVIQIAIWPDDRLKNVFDFESATKFFDEMIKYDQAEEKRVYGVTDGYEITYWTNMFGYKLFHKIIAKNNIIYDCATCSFNKGKFKEKDAKYILDNIRFK